MATLRSKAQSKAAAPEISVVLSAQGGPKTGKTTVLASVVAHLQSLGVDVEYIGENDIGITGLIGNLKPTHSYACESPQEPKTLLQQAHEIIHGDREQTYGDAGKNLRTIAGYWSIHLSATTGETITLTPEDVCGMMILLKQARLANSPKHRDSLMDIAGYAGLQDLL